MCMSVVPLGETAGETGFPPDALRETWDTVHDKSITLADKIEAHCLATGEHFDFMVAIPRGSYGPANIVTREFGIEAPRLLHACLTSYKDGATERSSGFIIGQMPTPEQVRGQDLLIIEDVCDSGHTLTFLTTLLQLAGAGLVRTGVLHYKPTRSTTGFQPDWWVTETDNWVVYPWDTRKRQDRSPVFREESKVAHTVDLRE